MRRVWPCALSFLAVSGVTATRVSPATVSSGTPINMDLPPQSSARDDQLAPSLQKHESLTHRARFVVDSNAPCRDRPLPSETMSDRWKPSVTVAAIVERITDGVSRFLLVEEH